MHFFPPESWLIYQHTSAYIPPMFKIPVLSIMISEASHQNKVGV